mgnify:CR=1 FL=1
MKKEKFVVINCIRELILNIDKYLVNFPKRDIEIKQQISIISKEMLLLAYEANASENKEKRKDIQEKIIARLKYLDFLINLCYDKQIINGKRYLKFGESIDYILKYANGWRKSTI